MRTLRTLVLCATFVSSAAAQGTLSTQGFGYPAGGLSTHAEALGGSIAENDPLSPMNPAALATWGRPGFYFQYDPEFRHVQANGASDNTTTARFPLLAGALNVGPRVTVGISSTTFLDRTWQTSSTGYAHFATGDSSLYNESFSTDGAINDVRLAGSYLVLPSLSVGIAGHVLTGQNRLLISRTFADTSFAAFSQGSTLSYTGHSFTGGVDWRPMPTLYVGVSGDAGGTMHAYRNDTTLSSARVPKRFGVGTVFGGVSGLSLSANAEWHGWSALNGLAESEIKAVDGWDWGLGAEVRAPSLFGQEFPLRLGYRHRILPFDVNTIGVHETDYSLGLGVPVSRGRSRVDFSITRANRSANVPDVSEHAWILSAGFFLRP
ncbi:MAG TPA: hypothetical protein VLI43_11115 [Gemmatimonadaceae bacterium]|nr:hypothetical protein [Gemmatimonadaceae bacterium]